jgi:hypothetical protein
MPLSESAELLREMGGSVLEKPIGHRERTAGGRASADSMIQVHKVGVTGNPRRKDRSTEAQARCSNIYAVDKATAYIADPFQKSTLS